MSDLLIRLYDLPRFDSEASVAAAGISIRRAIAPERHLILDWVRTHFSEGWASECAVAIGHVPSTLLIAVRGQELLGFACYDATMRGFFGPTAVHEGSRGLGIGEVLLIETLRAMREAGYAYGVIGGAGPVGFYKRRLDALDIPGSEPGIYGTMLRPQ